MNTLKVAFSYLLAFLMTIPSLSIIEEYTELITSPYKTWADMIFGAFYFTLFFTLFDLFVLRRFVSGKSK